MEYRKKALISFQLLRRLEESDVIGYCRCISCGQRGHYTTMDGGHFIPRRHRAVELDPLNVWAQCQNCNRHKGGNLDNYRVNLIKKIGIDKVESLESKAYTNVKRYNSDYIELNAQFRKAIAKILPDKYS